METIKFLIALTLFCAAISVATTAILFAVHSISDTIGRWREEVHTRKMARKERILETDGVSFDSRIIRGMYGHSLLDTGTDLDLSNWFIPGTKVRVHITKQK